MRIQTESLARLVTKANKVSLRSYKRVHHRITSLRSEGTSPMLFIFGCQRSGTTLAVNIFEKDLRTKVYREFSELSSMDTEDGLRYDPLPVLGAVIEKVPAPFIILKPLVESQNAPELLDYFPTAKAIWVYRDYRDVAASNLNKFGTVNGFHDLTPIVEGQADNWRSERVNSEVRNVIKENYTPGMNNHDAAALFWFVRNRLYFDLSLNNDPRIKLVKYEDLVHKPLDMVQDIYAFAGQPFPGSKIINGVHASSVGKGRDIRLSNNIDELCATLLKHLDSTYVNKNQFAFSQN